MPKPKALYFTPDSDANRLLAEDPLALLIGMLLDQQVTMEVAFRAPYLLRDRLGKLDAAAIASMDPDTVEAAFRVRPALHRFPTSMARRTHDLCRHIVEHHGGKPEAVWANVQSGEELSARVRALPGFGKDKSRIFIGLLGKRLGVQPPGWEKVAADWPSIADVDSYERLLEIREHKRAAKVAKAAAPAKSARAAK